VGHENHNVPFMLIALGFHANVYDYRCSIYYRGDFLFAMSRVERNSNWTLSGVDYPEKFLIKKAKSMCKALK
jgi:hypothetical protein